MVDPAFQKYWVGRSALLLLLPLLPPSANAAASETCFNADCLFMLLSLARSMPSIIRLRSLFSLRSIESTISSTGLAAPRVDREGVGVLRCVAADFLVFLVFLVFLGFCGLFFFLLLDPRLVLLLLEGVDLDEASPKGRSMWMLPRRLM